MYNHKCIHALLSAMNQNYENMSKFSDDLDFTIKKEKDKISIELSETSF